MNRTSCAPGEKTGRINNYSTYMRSPMSRFWRVFLLWALPLTGLWLFANSPRGGGTLKLDYTWAGFPWTFGCWQDGHVTWFDFRSLLLDIVVGPVAIGAVALACAASRVRHERRASSPPTPQSLSQSHRGDVPPPPSAQAENPDGRE